MRKLLAWKRPRVVLVTRAGLALVVALVLLITLTVFVLAVPQNGHAFYGNVATTGGRSLPAGTIVVAKAASGAWTGSVNTTVDALSRYGYGQLALLVPADDPESLAVVEGASKNDPIVFYVAGVKSKLKDMATGLVSDSYPFASGGLTNLDLSANITFTIQAAAGTHGTIDPLGAITVAYGDNKMFSFTPDTGYLITDVSVDGASNPGAKATGAYTFTNVTANHTISVTFAPLSYVITPTAGANGTITPGTPQTVSYGGSQTFAIAANTGYVIADVGVDGVSQGAIASYTFTNVTANHAITASFAVQTFVITPTAGANGTITPGAPQTVSYGGSQTFAIAANTGYVIADVTVDGVSQGPIASYTFTNVTANHAITASFAVQTFVITPTAGANGTITPGTPQTVSYGASQTFAIAANTGYVIADVTVDGVSQGPIAELHVHECDGEPCHHGELRGADLRDHADSGGQRDNLAGHASDGVLRWQPDLRHCCEYRLCDCRCDGGRRIAGSDRQLHVHECDGEPCHHGELRGADLRDYADSRGQRDNHAGHTSDGVLRCPPLM